MSHATQNFKKLFLIFSVIVSTLTMSLAWMAYKSFEPFNVNSNNLVFLFPRGKGPAYLMQILDENKLFKSPTEKQLFWWFGKLTKKWNHIKAGEYQVVPNENFWTLFEKLESGVSIQHPFTVTEGQNIYEIDLTLSQKGWCKPGQFVELVSNPAFIQSSAKLLSLSPPLPVNLEGYLFPDTYNLTRIMSLEDIARIMLKQFEKNWDKKWDQIVVTRFGLNRHQIIILASIIEKETGAKSERPLISGVFHNRLLKKMRLQSDPTTIYGIWQKYSGNLHKSDLLSPTPYNTYTVPALPMGPIANPGRLAIEAAVQPAQTQALYFVSHNDGTHEFTNTYADHLKAVQKFQLNASARQGHSWRELQKSN